MLSEMLVDKMLLSHSADSTSKVPTVFPKLGTGEPMAPLGFFFYPFEWSKKKILTNVSLLRFQQKVRICANLNFHFRC